MKECELCNSPARMYCESDQASLCWDCDAKVHCANFLVARHSRCLLCHVCQSPTPWKASGEKLGNTVSVCEKCVDSCNRRPERGGEEEKSEGRNDDEEDEEIDDEDESEDDDEDDDDDDNGDNDEDDDGDDEEEDGDNQVVPWSSTPPPPVASSSSSEESSSSRFCNGRGVSQIEMKFSLKRMRENADLGSQDDFGCSSSQPNYDASADDEATSFGSFKPCKDWKRALTIRSVQEDSKSTALMDSLKRLQQNVLSGSDTSAAVLDICKLSKDPRAVDLVSPDSSIPPI